MNRLSDARLLKVARSVEQGQPALEAHVEALADEWLASAPTIRDYVTKMSDGDTKLAHLHNEIVLNIFREAFGHGMKAGMLFVAVTLPTGGRA